MSMTEYRGRRDCCGVEVRRPHDPLFRVDLRRIEAPDRKEGAIKVPSCIVGAAFEATMEEGGP